MQPRVHDVKLTPAFFAEIDAERKNSEFRLNDRGYEVGDVMRLREWFPQPGGLPNGPSVIYGYTGREVLRRITHVLDHAAFEPVPEGWVVLSLVPYHPSETEKLAIQSPGVTRIQTVTSGTISARVPLEDALRETSRPDTPLDSVIVAGWYDLGGENYAFYFSTSVDVDAALMLTERARSEIIGQVENKELPHPDRGK